MASAEVFSPGTVSTSGSRYTGLNGCPMMTRSGCRHSDCSRVGRKPEDDEAMMTSGRATASMSRNSLIFSSSRSGAASCTKSALAAISARSVVKVSVPGLPTLPSRRAMDGQATAMAARRRASAAGDTS